MTSDHDSLLEHIIALIYKVAQKIDSIKLTPFLYALTSSNINRFSKFFHRQHQKKICNNTIAKDPTTPQLCRYTTVKNRLIFGKVKAYK